MDIRLSAFHLEGHRPDWRAAAVAGFAAGAVLMVLELLWTVLLGHGDPWTTSRMVAALVLGRSVLEQGGFSAGIVVLALAIHYLLGVVFGLVLAFLLSALHWDDGLRPGRMEFIGATFGVLLYLFNFHVMSQAFPWFADMRGWATLMAHLVFGLAAALLYWKLGRAPVAIE